jgi:small GTP-binding protein
MFDAFLQPSKPTIGSNHHRKRIALANGNPADLYVWDTAGQEQFQSLMPLYARSSSLAIVTAAINDEASFDSIPNWVETITTSCDTPPPIILAINKMDLTENMTVGRDAIHEKYDSQFIGIFFVSALSGEGVDQLFALAAVEAAKFSATSSLPKPKSVKLTAQQEGKTCCK